MRRIESHIDVNSEAFRANREENLSRMAAFREMQHAARFERPERSLERLLVFAAEE